ncbi:histone deacetylase 14 [Tanacetum coccineum]
MGIPICLGNVLGTSMPDALHVVHPSLGVYNPMRCLEGSLVGIVQLLQLRENTFRCKKILWREELVRLLVGSPGTSTTPICSLGSSSTPIYSPGSSTPPRYSPGASTPPSYSMGSSRNAECSNCKHLLDKIMVLEATEGHPECNSRLSAIVSALEKIHLTPKFRGSEIIQLQNYKTATFEDIADKHSRAYISPLKKTFKESLVSTGAGISLVDYVAESAKITKNPPIGFALICPGHHAVLDGPLEFCSVGNVATAAGYAQHVHGLQRVFIIDFSAHPGKGTNDVFNDDPDVFFLSTHQDGILPGAGKIDDIGCGNGVGATLNLPLPPYSGHFAMQQVFHQVIVPCTQRFKPDIILVSAGGALAPCPPLVSAHGGRCVFFLEGGYNLESLSNSVAESFRAFIEESSNAAEYDYRHFYIMEPFLGARQAIQKIKQLHSLENPNGA